MEKPAHDSLGILVHDAARALRRSFDARATALGLTTAQWRLLVVLFRLGPVTQARLAERLEVEPISVSRLVDRMAEQGWVTREPDPADRRIRIVVPTAKAEATGKEMRLLADDVFGLALAGLTEADRATLLLALAHIIRNLSEPSAPEARP